LWATPNPTHGTAFHFSLPALAMNVAVVEVAVSGTEFGTRTQ
jgi:hypothetical protein